MSAWQGALARLGSALDLAAGGFDAIAEAFRARREFRFVEGDDASFALQRRIENGEWTSIAGPVRIAESMVPSLVPAKTRTLMRGADLEVVLQTRHFLVRSLELPAGAAGFLDGVVRAQIDRLTPWKAAEAMFGSTPPETREGDRIVVLVVATARSRLATLLQALRTFEIDALRVLTEVGDGNRREEVCVFSETLGHGRRIQRLRSWLTVGLALSGLAAALGGAAWLALGANFDDQRAELEQSIAQRRADLMARRTGASGDAIAALDARKRDSLPIVLALESISNTLPDGAYLTDLHIEGGKLQIAGVTDDAASLIRLIEQSGQFSQAAFFEPTTRAPNESGERFHVEARIEPKWVGIP